jgi:hypothetical protein
MSGVFGQHQHGGGADSTADADTARTANTVTKYFSLGGCCAGLAFHSHNEVINMQIAG